MMHLTLLLMLAIRSAVSLISEDKATIGSCVKAFVSSVEGDLAEEIQSVLEPLEDEIIDKASTKCSKLKKILGVAYEDYHGEQEPSLEELRLDVKTRTSFKSYNMSEAVEVIPGLMEVNIKHKLLIFIHGFTDAPTSSSFGNISESFFERGASHVLALDASSLLKFLYLRSTIYVRFIGERLGAVLAAMVKNGVDPADIHIIGHSLGAHISGFTGKSFHNITNKKIGRISGLDPAGPCFSHVDSDLRLKNTDAEFVDVIHTDAGGFGLRAPVGHVDFYPNRGRDQPNCLSQTCSHSRSWLYYAESIADPKSFPAILCKNWASYKAGNCSKDISYMGYSTTPSVRGYYFLRTGEDFPYGLRDTGTKYEDPNTTKSVTSKVVRALRILANMYKNC